MHFKQHNIQRNRLLSAITIFAAVVFMAASCHPTPVGPDPDNPTNACADGVYILNEGLFQMNNSTLSYYDFKTSTLTDDIFLERNHRGLGDTGSDLKSYGSKLYCIVNNSNRLEIMKLSDATSIKAIDLAGKQPRKIAFHRGKAYVSCFDGDILRIDTTTLEVEAATHSGDNPDGLCVCNDKLYVANSGGLNYPNYGNTVSVIDLNSFSVIKTLTVVENPTVMNSYNDQYVYVESRGNYADVPYAFQKIDAQTDQIVKNYNLEVLNFTIEDHFAYLYSYDYSTASSWIKVMDLRTDQLVRENFITDGTTIANPYAINVNPLNGDVYIADALDYTVNGDIVCFSKDGKKKFSFSAGLNPCGIVFKN